MQNLQTICEESDNDPFDDFLTFVFKVAYDYYDKETLKEWCNSCSLRVGGNKTDLIQKLWDAGQLKNYFTVAWYVGKASNDIRRNCVLSRQIKAF